MNIWTRGSFRAMPIDCLMYEACCASVTPAFSAGRVSWPYCVLQIGKLLRLNHVSSDFSNWGNDASDTFGQRTFCVGFIRTGTGYGWCAQASNFRRGFACATSCAKRPGECVPDLPASGLSRPADEVSPMPTSARELPALMPAYAAA